MICIICREEKEGSDEHVIPDAIGGYYHIYNVCKKCNSDLGTKVDSPLVNHKFIEFARFLHGVKGKDGGIPNPFSGTMTMPDIGGARSQIRIGDNGEIVPYLLPSVAYSLRV